MVQPPPYLQSMLQHQHVSARSEVIGQHAVCSPGLALPLMVIGPFLTLPPAPCLWNSLPKYLRDTHDISHFQQSLKTHLFRLAYEHIREFYECFTEKMCHTNAVLLL